MAGVTDSKFDLTGEGQVDVADLDAWRSAAGEALLGSGKTILKGDADLNGLVDGTDFNAWNANKFTQVPAWCLGDFNADGNIDGSDFNLWNNNKFTSSDAAVGVPEPAGFIIDGSTCHRPADVQDILETTERDFDRLTFSALFDWITQICVINADGTGFHPLTDGTHTDFNQTWTRDGKNTPIWNRKNPQAGSFHGMASKAGAKPGEEISLTDRRYHIWASSCLQDGRIRGGTRRGHSMIPFGRRTVARQDPMAPVFPRPLNINGSSIQRAERCCVPDSRCPRQSPDDQHSGGRNTTEGTEDTGDIVNSCG